MIPRNLRDELAGHARSRTAINPRLCRPICARPSSGEP
jgi:hypothetical protein